jgi:hypothetical protein
MILKFGIFLRFGNLVSGISPRQGIPPRVNLAKSECPTPIGREKTAPRHSLLAPFVLRYEREKLGPGLPPLRQETGPLWCEGKGGTPDLIKFHAWLPEKETRAVVPKNPQRTKLVWVDLKRGALVRPNEASAHRFEKALSV